MANNPLTATTPEELRQISDFNAYLNSVANSYRQRQAGRSKQFSRLASQIKKVSVAIILIAFMVAILCDVLSLFEVELDKLTAILDFLTITLVAGQVIKIEKGMRDITQSIVVGQAELQQARQRLLSHNVPEYNTLANQKLPAESIVGQAGSYLYTFIRDFLVKHLIELIPIVNLLPAYIGQVYKTYRDQKKKHLEAKKLLDQYELLIKRTAVLENAELELLGLPLRAALAEQRATNEFAQELLVLSQLEAIVA